MSEREKPQAPERREFLKGATIGAAAVVAGPAAHAREATGPGAPARGTQIAPPTAASLARDAGNVSPGTLPVPGVRRPGSDLMVQTLKELGIEFIAANPGSSFEGLQ